MSEKETTIQSLFDSLDQWGAATARIVLRNHDDEPFRAVIVVDGIEETKDVIEALDKLEESWNNDGA